MRIRPDLSGRRGHNGTMASFVLRLGLIVALLTSASCGSPDVPALPPMAGNQLRGVADFSVIADKKDRSRALFVEASRVFLHPRCFKARREADSCPRPSAEPIGRRKMTDRIEGKIVVITGASSGLGEAAARHLAAQGAKVVLGARRADRLEALVGDIVAAGGQALAVQTDVTNRADVAHLVDTAVQVFGRIDVLINNAGIMPLSALESLKVDEWDRMIDVNIKGVLYGIAAALPHMKKQKSGHVITTASVAGHLVFPASSVYSGTKFAVRAICEGFRQEVKAYNIRSTILCPGAVKTELLEHISDDGVRAANSDYVGQVGISADSFARMAAFAIGQPDDVDVNEIIFRPTAQQL